MTTPANPTPEPDNNTEFVTRYRCHLHLYKNGVLIRWAPANSCTLEQFKEMCKTGEKPKSEPDGICQTCRGTGWVNRYYMIHSLGVTPCPACSTQDDPLKGLRGPSETIADLTDELSDTRRRLAEADRRIDGIDKALEQRGYVGVCEGVRLGGCIDYLLERIAELEKDAALTVERMEAYAATKTAALRNAADGMACAVGAAPHDKSCYWWPKHPRGEPGACTCWKHKALAAYSALISEGAGS